MSPAAASRACDFAGGWEGRLLLSGSRRAAARPCAGCRTRLWRSSPRSTSIGWTLPIRRHCSASMWPGRVKNVRRYSGRACGSKFQRQVLVGRTETGASAISRQIIEGGGSARARSTIHSEEAFRPERTPAGILMIRRIGCSDQARKRSAPGRRSAGVSLAESAGGRSSSKEGNFMREAWTARLASPKETRNFRGAPWSSSTAAGRAACGRLGNDASPALHYVVGILTLVYALHFLPTATSSMSDPPRRPILKQEFALSDTNDGPARRAFGGFVVCSIRWARAFRIGQPLGRPASTGATHRHAAFALEAAMTFFFLLRLGVEASRTLGARQARRSAWFDDRRHKPRVGQLPGRRSLRPKKRAALAARRRCDRNSLGRVFLGYFIAAGSTSTIGWRDWAFMSAGIARN